MVCPDADQTMANMMFVVLMHQQDLHSQAQHLIDLISASDINTMPADAVGCTVDWGLASPLCTTGRLWMAAAVDLGITPGCCTQALLT